MEHTITDVKMRLANAYHDEGRFTLAVELLTSIRPVADAPAEEQIRWLHARALLYDSEGLFKEADGLFDDIHNLFENMAAIGPEQGAALTNAAMFKLENGWPSQAKILLELAEKIDQRYAPFSFRVKFLKAKAHLALRTKEPQEAMVIISTAQKLVRDGLEDDEEQRLQLMLLERDALLQLGGDLDIAREISRILPPENSTDSIDCLKGGRLDTLVILTRALVFEKDNTEGARKLLRLSLRAEAARKNPELRWVIFYSLAVLLAHNGRETTAILCAKLAVETIHTMIGSLPFNTPQREAVLKSRLDAFLFLNRILLAHGKFPESQIVLSLLSSDVVTNIAPFKRQFKVSVPNVPYTNLETGIARQYWKNVSSAHEFHNQPANSERSGNQVQRDRHLDEIGKFYDRLWNEEKPASSLFEADVDLDFPREKGGNKVLRFAANGNVVRVFLTGEEGTVCHQVEENLPETATAIHALHKSVSCGLPDWKPWSEKLYNILLRSFEAEFEHTEEMHISTKGIFSRIPFAALFDGKALLVEKFPLIYRTFIAADSPSLLREYSSVVAFGSSQQHGNFPPLSNVRSELVSLAEKFQYAEVLIDDDFTKEAFIDGLKQHPDVVHLATHFKLQPGSPQQSIVLLGDGEYLPLSVIGSDQFDWTGVRLAFLSACETGTADHEPLEGGTIAAYLQSLGVDWTVATLWLIHDQTTGFLVKQFYAHLAAEKCPAKALQAAQVSLLNPAPQTKTGIGKMLEAGAGVARDYKQAANWYQKAADQGNAKAQFNLAILYYDGKGVTRDEKRAIEWFQKAADLGHKEARKTLSAMGKLNRPLAQKEQKSQPAAQAEKPSRPVTVKEFKNQNYSLQRILLIWRENRLKLKSVLEALRKKDYARAIAGLEPLANNGNSIAQYNLALMYTKGQGVVQDDSQAVKWYRKAADQGDASAQFSLGVKLLYSKNIQKNYIQAYMFFSLAAASGYKDAPKAVEEAERKMTRGQIRKAKEKTKEWQARFAAKIKN